MKNNLKLRETNKLKNKQKHTRSIKRDITFICICYNIICATLYFVLIPDFFKLIFGFESLNLVTGHLILISLVGVGLSIFCMICDRIFKIKFKFASPIVSILGYISFLQGKFVFTLIPVILMIISVILYVKIYNKKQIRIIK